MAVKLQNLHTHTVFGDGQNTAEEMVRAAIAAGCGSLGFSEHSRMPAAVASGWCMTEAEESAYRQEVLRLREAYAGQIDLFLGLERDLDALHSPEPYEYLIGSVHGVWRSGVYLPVDASQAEFCRAVRERYAGDYFAFIRDYYQREASVVLSTRCQIVGHFDLVAKFNEGGCLFDEADPRCRDASLGALEALSKQDVVFEINTGAMSRNCRTVPYPSDVLLRSLRDFGGRVCISSDSHSASTITHGFAQAAELALSCGFRETYLLARDGFHAVGLEEFRDEAKRRA